MRSESLILGRGAKQSLGGVVSFISILFYYTETTTGG